MKCFAMSINECWILAKELLIRRGSITIKMGLRDHKLPASMIIRPNIVEIELIKIANQLHC